MAKFIENQEEASTQHLKCSRNASVSPVYLSNMSSILIYCLHANIHPKHHYHKDYVLICPVLLCTLFVMGDVNSGMENSFTCSNMAYNSEECVLQAIMLLRLPEVNAARV